MVRLTGPAYLAAGPFLVGGSRYAYSFVTKRVPEKSRYFRGAGHGQGATRPLEPQRGGRSMKKLKNAGVLRFS